MRTHTWAWKCPQRGGHLWSLLRGVPIFFMLSGFLLWGSLERNDDLKTYCSKRIARLYPELWGGVAVNAIVMLVFYGGSIVLLPFLAHIFGQATILQFWTPDSLRGYGCGTPNGSLWTIGVMVQCYVVFYLVYKLLRNRKLYVQLFTLLIFAGCNYLPMVARKFLPEMLVKLLEQTFVPYFWLFLAGGLIAAYFDKIIHILKKWWFLCFALSAAASISGLEQGIGAYELIKSLTMGLAMVGFAYRYPKLNIGKDYSYGFYIYHMIVINLLIHLGFTGSIWSVLVALAASCLCAVASYYISHTLGKKPVSHMK